MKRPSLIIASGVVLAAFAWIAGPSAASSSARDRCVSDKNGAMGKFSACVLKAKRSYVLSGDAARYDASIAKCEAAQAVAFGKAEAQAGPGNCPFESDAAAISDFTSASLGLMSEALAGGTLPADLTACYDDLATCEGNFGTCDSDLQACLSQLDSSLLKTGQTGCSDVSGGSVNCTGSGQDGEFQAGISPSYTDNADGTLTDNVTGLTWEKLSNDGSIHDKDTTYLWANVFGKIASLNSANFAGHGDWRMPNIRELETLVDFGRSFPTTDAVFRTTCTNGCTVLTCSCTPSSSFWSSTSYDPDESCAWSVDFSIGARAGVLKTSTYLVRAVRGGL